MSATLNWTQALELALRDLGYKAEPGAGVAAAQAVFANGA